MRRCACAVLIALAAFAAYSQTFHVPLVFDDLPAIPGNPSLRHWSTVLLPPAGSTAGGRPILNLSLAINYAISGTNVWSYHVANLLIHILAGLTLFGIVRRTFVAAPGRAWNLGRGGGEAAQAPVVAGGSPWSDKLSPFGLGTTLTAFVIALLWTLHPLQTESVTYIVQRAESLMGLFYLLTLYCFIRGTGTAESNVRALPGAATRSAKPASIDPHELPLAATTSGARVWLGLSWLACLLGMATKEVMVSAPLIVFLYDRTFVAGGFRGAWARRRGYHLALASTWIILLLLVHSTHGRGGTAGFGSGISWWSYALAQSPAILGYLRLSFWPHPLVFFYGPAPLPSAPVLAACILAVVALLVATVWALVRRPVLGFLGASFFAILAPSSSVVPLAMETVSEHRMYLPLAAVIALAVCGVEAAARRFTGEGKRRLPRRGAAKTGAAAFTLPLFGLAAASLFVTTLWRNEDYRSALALWTTTVKERPASAFARTNLALELKKMPGGLYEAMAEFERAIQLDPGDAEAHNDLGNAFVDERRMSEAAAQFAEAVRLKPNDPEPHNNFGNVLASEGRIPDAVRQYEDALRLRPDHALAHYNLANALAAEGLTDEAIAHYRDAIRLLPGYAPAHNNLGMALAAEGRTDEAVKEYEEAIRLRPGDANARRNLDDALGRR